MYDPLIIRGIAINKCRIAKNTKSLMLIYSSICFYDLKEILIIE